MSVAEPAVDTKEDNPYRDIDSEPTETLPNGIPTAGFVRLDLTQEQVAVAKGTFFGAMTPIDIGNQLAMKERVDLYPWMAEQPPFAKFVLGNRTSYKFNFLFTPTVSDVRQLFDVQRPSKDELTLEQLPSDFRAAIEKAKEEMKKAMQDMKPGDMGNGGGNYKPPPYCFMP